MKQRHELRTEFVTFFASFFQEFRVTSSPPMVGFSPPIGHSGAEPEPGGDRPLSQQWLTGERIAKARDVWSKAYGRVISPEEAIEILTNVRQLAEVLIRAEEEKEPS